MNTNLGVLSAARAEYILEMTFPHHRIGAVELGFKGRILFEVIHCLAPSYEDLSSDVEVVLGGSLGLIDISTPCR